MKPVYLVTRKNRHPEIAPEGIHVQPPAGLFRAYEQAVHRRYRPRDVSNVHCKALAAPKGGMRPPGYGPREAVCARLAHRFPSRRAIPK
eukprot:2291697-Rhodomonas_salina.3